MAGPGVGPDRRALGDDLAGLHRDELAGDPLVQLRAWMDDATRAGLSEPGAMALATADASGRPSARMVLLRGLDQAGLVFFTNYHSRKGRELAANPRAALVFHWAGMQRQVTATGAVTRTSAEQSDAYFASRPRGHRLAAWASDQSRVIADRKALERRFRQAHASHAGGDVPRPAWWGGFRLVPEEVEFWQGRSDRLHDRLRYRRDGGGWLVERLAP